MVLRAANENDAPAIARVHVASWQTSYHGLLPDSLLDSLDVREREATWARALARSPAPDSGYVVYVAEDDVGEVVGFASGGPERENDPEYTGELYALYLVQASQRQGRGRALARAVARDLQAAGHEKMLVWVLANNSARHFYEALGGRFLREKVAELRGVPTLEVAYGLELDTLLLD